MNWGHKIVLGFILFAAFVITLVFKMITSGNDLVKPKYYRTGEQINNELKLEHESAKLSQRITIQPDPNRPGILEIRFDSLAGEISGIAQLTCLSDDKADQAILLKPTTEAKSKIQSIKLLRPKMGMWICEMNGKVDGKPFLLKKQFRL